MKKLAVLLLCLVFISGCGVSEDYKKVKDLDFTVVTEEEIPEELYNVIEEKKEAEFNLTYKDGDYLYIVTGRGQQETGGYSMAVSELYLSDNAICVDVDLIGPSADEEVSKAKSYPYIVIKIESLDLPVIFL